MKKRSVKCKWKYTINKRYIRARGNPNFSYQNSKGFFLKKEEEEIKSMEDPFFSRTYNLLRFYTKLAQMTFFCN